MGEEREERGEGRGKGRGGASPYPTPGTLTTPITKPKDRYNSPRFTHEKVKHYLTHMLFLNARRDFSL